MMRASSLLLVVLPVSTHPGCVSIDDVPVENIVMVNGDGRLVDPSPNLWGMYSSLRSYPEIPEQDIKRHLGSVLTAMRNHTDSARSNGHKRKVLIYVHGGLNSETGSIERATSIHKKLLEQDYAAFPLFLIWPSSLHSSYVDHLLWVRQGKSRWWGPVLAPLYLAEDVLRTVARAPIVWLYQMGHTVTSFGVTSPDERVAARRWESRRDLKIKRGRECRAAWEGPVLALSNALTLPIRVVTMPIVDAAGSSAWRNMLRRTSMFFDTQEEFETDFVPEGAKGGLSRFLDRLEQQCDKERDGWEITLVGHSMGAIIVNQILRRYPTLPVKNIVYMAAACSVREYQDSVFPFMERPEHRDTRMYHLVLHEDAETNEIFWAYPEFVPRGSLLIWIDNFYERPDTWLDRRAGRWVNLMAGIHLREKSISDRVFIKQFDVGRDAPQGNPQVHGGFGQFAFWEQSFWWE